MKNYRHLRRRKKGRLIVVYYGKGVGRKLMDVGLEHIKRFPQVRLWVLKENRRAIHFYEKCGFLPDGSEMTSPNISETEIRMI